MHSVDLAPAEDYFTIMATWDYGRVVAARGSGSIIFVFSIMGAAPHEADAIFQSGCVSCRAKWKADLCSLVKHHLCWHGRADLCRARGIQRTFVVDHSLQNVNAVTGCHCFLFFFSPGSEATRGHYLKAPAAPHEHASFMGWQRRALWKWRQEKQENYGCEKDDCVF